ncbi:MAG: hypothetical protein NVS4B7_10820 [Ktedonobacteraceae bacterium]
MLINEAGNNQPLTLQAQQTRAVEIAEALPMRLQTLDLTRHTVIAPDGMRYVVATFDDRRLGRGYVTAIYPQQNNYLTLVRLTIAEFSSPTPEEAIQRHLKVAQSIQQGKIKEFNKSI